MYMRMTTELSLMEACDTDLTSDYRMSFIYDAVLEIGRIGAH